MQLDRPLAVITPTLDGDVLAVLAYRRTSGATPGQIQYLLDRYSTQGIRVSLARLCEQGVVERRKAANSYLYCLNPRHLAAPAILALAAARGRLVRRTAALLLGWPDPPVYAALFGPAARAPMTTSDAIGLFVACAGDGSAPWLDECTGSLVDALRDWTGNDIDLRVVADHAEPAPAERDVLEAVTRSGLRIVGWPSWPERRSRDQSQSRLRNEP